MKCKFCDRLIINSMGWRSSERPYTTNCTKSDVMPYVHEPAEPEAAPAENIMHKSFDYQADPATSGKATKLVADSGPRVDTRRFPPTTQATEPRPEIHTVGFKPLMGEAVEPQKVSISPGELLLKISRPIVREDPGPDVDYSDSDGEAASQKVDQPAVDPVEFYEQSVVSEAGSARPEMPPTKENLCGIAENVQPVTREDIRPIAETVEHSEVHHLPDQEWNELSKESQAKISKWFELATKYLQAILDERAASVHQEPRLVVGEQCPTCQRRYLGEMGNGDYSCCVCGMGMVEPCEHWKAMEAESQPAAPRTQGREPEYDPQKDPSTNWVLDYAIELENIQRSRNHMLEDERGNRSPVLTRGTIIDTIWKYLLARTQPAPKCPKCGSKFVDVGYAEDGWIVAHCRNCSTARGGNDASEFFRGKIENE